MTANRLFKSLFLPSGLVLAICLGLLWPARGRWLHDAGVFNIGSPPLCVIVIFLVTGYGLSGKDFKFDPKFPTALVSALIISLAGGPAVALGMAYLMGLKEGLYLGLIVIACMPTTLSSAVVITRSAGGNAVWALMLTVILNLAGAFIVPFTVGFCLRVGGGVEIAPWPIFFKIIRLLIIPLCVGMIFRKLLKGRTHGVLGYIPSAGVILLVWMAVSKQAEKLRSFTPMAFVLVVIGSITVHSVLLAAGWLCRYPLKLPAPEATALLFGASQKTLPIALTVLMLLPGEKLTGAVLGVATVVCVTFHFSQIILDSFLAAKLRPKPAPT